MNIKDIKQWTVSNGVATPVNPHCPDITFSTSIFEKSKLFEQFHQSAKPHTYATNAQDGVYDAACFGHPVWQYREGKPFGFANEPNNVDASDKGYETRQFLPFNPIPKMETTELPSPEKDNKEGYVDFRNPFENYPELSARLLHAESFWKVDDTWSATLAEINKVCEQLTIAKQSAWQSKKQ